MNNNYRLRMAGIYPSRGDRRFDENRARASGIYPSYRTAEFRNPDERLRRILRNASHIGVMHRYRERSSDPRTAYDTRRQRAALTLRRHLPVRFSHYFRNKYRRSAREASCPSYLIRQRG